MEMHKQGNLEHLELYIENLKAQEKKINMRNQAGALIGFIVSSIFIMLMVLGLKYEKINEQYISVPLAEIEEIPLHNLFRDKIKGVIVIVDERYTVDTFFSKIELINYLNTNMYFEEEEMIVEDNQTNHRALQKTDLIAKAEKELPLLPVYPVLIEGNMHTGETISFSVQTYDPSVEFEIDFGDGLKISMQDRVEYIYLLPGTYEVTVKASIKGMKSSVYQEIIYITDKRPVSGDEGALYLAKL